MTRPVTLELITGPLAEPVTLAEAKAQCKVQHSVDDALLGIFIASARETAEHITGRVFVSQTWEQRLDLFPSESIELLRPPVLAITSVKYIDANEAEQTISSDDYSLDGNLLLPDLDYSWPGDTLATKGAVRIRFTAGYGDADDVPASIKHWMLLQIAAAYRNREAFQTGISAAELPNRFVATLLERETVYL